MKRWQRWTIIGVGVFVLLGVIGSLTAPDEEEETLSASQTTVATVPETTTTVPASPTTTVRGTTATTPATTTPAPAASPTNYPGKQKDDRVAALNSPIDLSGFTTTVSAVSKSSDGLSRRLICANVNIINRDTRSQRYSQFDFRLQTPGGEVKDSTITLEGSLDSGDLINGGSKTGKVCWDDAGQPGLHLVIWKPDAFKADRAVWLAPL